MSVLVILPLFAMAWGVQGRLVMNDAYNAETVAQAIAKVWHKDQDMARRIAKHYLDKGKSQVAYENRLGRLLAQGVRWKGDHISVVDSWSRTW